MNRKKRIRRKRWIERWRLGGWFWPVNPEKLREISSGYMWCKGMFQHRWDETQGEECHKHEIRINTWSRKWRRSLVSRMVWEGFKKECYLRCWEGTEGKSECWVQTPASILCVWLPLSLAEDFREERIKVYDQFKEWFFDVVKKAFWV